MKIDTSKWETFKNTFYSFKYPAGKYIVDWGGLSRDDDVFLREDIARSGESNCILSMITGDYGPRSSSIDEYMGTEFYESNFVDKKIRIVPTTIAGIKAFKVANMEGQVIRGLSENSLIFMHKGRIYFLAIDPGLEPEQILKTFELV